MRITTCLLGALVVAGSSFAQPQNLAPKTRLVPIQGSRVIKASTLGPGKRLYKPLPGQKSLIKAGSYRQGVRVYSTIPKRPSNGGYTVTGDELQQIAETYEAYKRAKDASVMASLAGVSYATIAKTQSANAEGIQKTFNVLGVYRANSGLAYSKQAEAFAGRLRKSNLLRSRVLRPVMYLSAAAAVYEVYRGMNAGKNLKSRAILEGRVTRPVNRSIAH